MDEFLKQALKLAPIPTIAIGAFSYVALNVIERTLPIWGYLLTLGLSFLLSLFLLQQYFKVKHKNSIRNNSIDKVDTEGGEFLVGEKGASSGHVDIDNNTIKNIKTRGGNFTIGKKG